MAVPIPGIAANPGAKLWDLANQGSAYTHQPGQPPLIVGGPEGVVYGSPGLLAVNETGRLYIKKTAADLNTGWCFIPCCSLDDYNECFGRFGN